MNSPPVAVNDAAMTNEDTVVTINVLANDSDPNLGDTISIKSVGTPSKGTASIVSGKILYTPSLNYNGIDSFSYIIQDSQGATSSATATITVNAVNDAPTAKNDISSTNQNAPLVLNFNSLTSNDTDPDIGDSLTIASVSNPLNGVVTINFLSNSITYTPTINFVGTGSFQYTVTDGNGGTSVATVTVTVI